MSAKTGDVVSGSKGTGMYMGDGQVLMEDGTRKPLIDVFEFRPPNSGFFHLELPPLPAGDDFGSSGPAPAPPAATPSPDVAPAPQQQSSQPAAAAAPPEAAAEPAPAAGAQPVAQQSAPAGQPDAALPFPVITTETAPRSW